MATEGRAEEAEIIGEVAAAAAAVPAKEGGTQKNAEANGSVAVAEEGDEAASPEGGSGGAEAEDPDRVHALSDDDDEELHVAEAPEGIEGTEGTEGIEVIEATGAVTEETDDGCAQGPAEGETSAADEEGVEVESATAHEEEERPPSNLDLSNIEALREVSDFAQTKLQSRMANLSSFLHGGGQSAMRKFLNPHAKEKVDKAIGGWMKRGFARRKASAPVPEEPPVEEAAAEEESAVPEEEAPAREAPPPELEPEESEEESDEEALDLNAYDTKKKEIEKERKRKEKEDKEHDAAKNQQQKAPEEEAEEVAAEEEVEMEPVPEDPMDAYEQVFLKMIKLSEQQRVDAEKERNRSLRGSRWKSGMKKAAIVSQLGKHEYNVEKHKTELEEQARSVAAMVEGPQKQAAEAKLNQSRLEIEKHVKESTQKAAEMEWRDAADLMRAQRALVQELDEGSEEEAEAIQKLQELESEVAKLKDHAHEVGCVVNTLSHKNSASSRAAMLAKAAADAEAKLIASENARVLSAIDNGNEHDDWHQKLKDRRLPDGGRTKKDWTDDVVASKDEGDVPVYFRNVEDQLLATHLEIVNEVRVRETVDLELDGSLQTIQERWADKLKGENKHLETKTNELTNRIHERFWGVQTLCLKTSFDQLYKYDLAYSSRALTEFAEQFEPQVTELAEKRSTMKANFERKVQEKFDEVTGMILETRKERLRVEEMMLTFLGNMCQGSVLENDTKAKQVEKLNTKKALGIAKKEAEKAAARALKAEADCAAELEKLECWLGSANIARQVRLVT